MANGPRADAGPERVMRPQRLVAEALGTFLLVLGAAGAVVVDEVSHGQIGRTAEVTVPGLTVMAVILSLGALSGAHLNPAVTVAFALRRDFPWARVPGYVIAQLIGSVAACGVLRAMFGRVGGAGATVPILGRDRRRSASSHATRRADSGRVREQRSAPQSA